MKIRAVSLPQLILRAKRWSASPLSYRSYSLLLNIICTSLLLSIYISLLFPPSLLIFSSSLSLSCTLTLIYAHKITLFHTDPLPSIRTQFVDTRQVFKDYFGELEEESIRDNFVVVYELLDETMDFGYPQTCESRILREWVCKSSCCTSMIYLICSLEENRQAIGRQ